MIVIMNNSTSVMIICKTEKIEKKFNLASDLQKDTY